jgi:hypothetical protein
MTAAERTALAMRTPTAAATFVRARDEGLSADDMADPAVALAIASAAMEDLSPWTGSASSARASALEEVTPLEALASAVMSDARNEWWWSDLRRDRQVWVSDEAIDLTDFELPASAAQPGWENYAQHPAFDDCVVTSTELLVPEVDEIRSGVHNELAHTVPTDWYPPYPLHQATVSVRAYARVFEIHQPQAWHALAARYGDAEGYRGPDQNLLASAAIDHGPAPDWRRVAVDWDGVHLSFFGLLTTLYTPITTDDVSTTLWAWSSERTLWLRSAFDAVTPLPALDAEPYPLRQF